MFLDGLLGPERRKTAWMRAEAAGDTVYEVGELEMALRRAGKGYVLGVTGAAQFNSWGKWLDVAGSAEGPQVGDLNP